MRNVIDEMVEALNENILLQTNNDQLTLAAAGFSSLYAKAKIGHSVMERLIKQRGIGLAFPCSKAEIVALNERLYNAQKSSDENELIVRNELADEQSTSAWKEMIDLSGGHTTVDFALMKVEIDED
jgi:arginyl-tRNA synthetase